MFTGVLIVMKWN